jgi:hypothetical protein
MGPYLKISEAASRLSVCRNTILAMMRDGRVLAVNINPRGKRPSWRITAASLDGFRAEPLRPEIIEEKLRNLDIERRLGL